MEYQIGVLIFLLVVIAWRLVNSTRDDRSLGARYTPEPLEPRKELARPPDDVHDAAAWDEYWDSQLANPQVAAIFLMFGEMFSDDRELVDLMKREGMQSVLCVGNGASREPAALARAGLSVVALDISPRACEVSRGLRLDEEALHRFIDPIQAAEGGRVEFVAGDFTDSSVCPGPFDVIIERRTVQLFGDNKGEALQALASRLATPGLLFSHCHDGSWRPSQPREHANEKWFRDHGWPTFGSVPGDDEISGKVAWLLLSTG